MRYGPDWQPIELKLDATLRGAPIGLCHLVRCDHAISEITQSGQTTQKTDEIAAKTIVLLNNHFAGAYEALAARHRVREDGRRASHYIAQAEIPVRIGDISAESIHARGSNLWFAAFSSRSRIPRAHSRPRSGSTIVRGSPDSKSRPCRCKSSGGAGVGRGAPRDTSHPGDVLASIPAAGFTLAATVTRPPGPAVAARRKLPAVILVGGSGPTDRDQVVAGIPIFGQLAGVLADAGFIVTRYDKRGVGQVADDSSLRRSPTSRRTCGRS